MARRLAEIDPSNRDWQAEVEDADTSLGVVLLNQGRAEEAARDFEDALAISRRLVAAPAPKRDWQWVEAQSFAWLGDAEIARGRLDAALTHRQAEGRVYSALITASPHDNDAAMALANSRAEMARIELARGGSAAATLTLQAVAAQMDQLARQAPDNTIYQAEVLTILRLLAQALLEDGQLRAAGAAASRAVALCEAQVSSAAVHRDAAIVWPVRLAGARVVALKIAAADAATAADQRQALQGAPDEAARLRALLAGHPKNRALAVTAAEAALLAGDYEDLAGEPARARSDWAWSRSILAESPQTVAETYRTPVLLRQATYRLSLLHPPTGPLSPRSPSLRDRPVRVRALPKGQRSPADYRW
jgi:tetratricopeptide (TPR) repeat protein